MEYSFQVSLFWMLMLDITHIHCAGGHLRFTYCLCHVHLGEHEPQLAVHGRKKEGHVGGRSKYKEMGELSKQKAKHNNKKQHHRQKKKPPSSAGYFSIFLSEWQRKSGSLQRRETWLWVYAFGHGYSFLWCFLIAFCRNVKCIVQAKILKSSQPWSNSLCCEAKVW